MKKTKKALSLVIAISITLIMGLLALYILEYIIPFSRNTKNIEHSVSAYYMADSAIEDALYSMSGSDISYENNTLLPTTSTGYGIEMTAKGKILPPLGQGNSEFDSDYNIIRIGEPTQIEVGKNFLSPLANFDIFFKIPDINSSSTENLSGGTTLKIINWQLSSNSNILNAKDTQITSDEIDGSDINIGIKNGLRLDGTTQTFQNFYTANCSGSLNSCKLKMSVINKLELTDGTSVPYLEWKITTDSEIPLRYRIIETTGKSYGFRKTLNVKIPQQTVNEAFDFTVFQ